MTSYTITKTLKTELLFPGSSESLKKSLSLKADKICLFADAFCLKKFAAVIKTAKNASPGSFFYVFKLPPGEKAKTTEIYFRAASFLFKNGFTRRSTLIALGGGAACDFTGFLAGTFHRGVDLINIPTTFLSRIDASLGGKTALNFSETKNILGVFKNPRKIIFLSPPAFPLEKETLAGGAGELVKYLFLKPEAFPADRASFLKKVLSGDAAASAKAMKLCVSIKASVVELDPEDENGKREKLNLGHTAGHAFEILSKGRLCHGDSVLWGLRYAFLLSEELSVLQSAFRAKAIELLKTHQPGSPAVKISFKNFLKTVSADKKRLGFRNRFLIFKTGGEIKAAEDISEKKLEKAFRRLKNDYPDFERA